MIGDMLFVLNDEDEWTTKERALSMFKSNEDHDKMYAAVIKNMKQF